MFYKKKYLDYNMKLKYVCDNKRHLICVPYSKDNLHKMAEELNIKRCWFHKNHYDIPVRRKQGIEKLCQVISPKEIVEIIRHPEYADAILSSDIIGSAAPADFFLLTQLKYQGYEQSN